MVKEGLPQSHLQMYLLEVGAAQDVPMLPGIARGELRCAINQQAHAGQCQCWVALQSRER